MAAMSGWFGKLSVLGLTDNVQSGILRVGLQRLLLLRIFVTFLSVLALAILENLTPISAPLPLMGILLITLGVSLLAGFWRLKTAKVISHYEFFAHLLIDVLVLIVLLSVAGGASNPLISYLLVLLAIVATLLPPIFAFIFAISGILIYSFFLIRDLNVDHSDSMASMQQGQIFELHLVGMWVIFSVSAILISFFLTRLSSAIREREIMLSEVRENELRNEQLVEIGMLAAGTAHAIGTPLSTMSVLLAEIDLSLQQRVNAESLKEDILTLRQQLSRCKSSLNELVHYYHKDNPKEEENWLLSDFVSELTDYVTNIHPGSQVEFVLETEDDPYLTAELSLRHAVINIIENGIKAAAQKVEVRISSPEGSRLEILVTDDGPGMPTEVMEKMGEPFISTRKDSMGLGIFLANAAVQRLGGEIEMYNLQQGGATTLISFPLSLDNRPA
jgi:two-component system sensor histidine kinase RegB